MRKVLFIGLLIACFAPLAAAQNNDSRAEFFAGYSLLRTDVSREDFSNFNQSNDEPFKNLNGFNVAATGYITEKFGLTADFSAHFKTQNDAFTFSPPCTTTPCPAAPTFESNVDAKARSLNFLAGPQARFANSTRVTPFVRALAGVQHNRLSFENAQGGTSTSLFTNSSTSGTDFALGLGGGLDIGVSDRVAIRAFQVDYNPVFERDRTVNFGGISQQVEGDRTDNVRFSVGVVFK